MNEVERHVWARLRSRRFVGFKFRRQVPVGPYVVDFLCLSCRLVVEIDGGGHARPDQRASDEQRTQWLESQGFQVLRFWSHEVTEDWDAVEEAIWAALQRRLEWNPLCRGGVKRVPLTLPSPARGEGVLMTSILNCNAD